MWCRTDCINRVGRTTRCLCIWHIWNSLSFAVLPQDKWFILSLWLYSSVVSDGKQVPWIWAEVEICISVTKVQKFSCEHLEVFVWKLFILYIWKALLYLFYVLKRTSLRCPWKLFYLILFRSKTITQTTMLKEPHVLKGDDYAAHLSLVYPNSVYFLL